MQLKQEEKDEMGKFFSITEPNWISIGIEYKRSSPNSEEPYREDGKVKQTFGFYACKVLYKKAFYSIIQQNRALVERRTDYRN